ncbi:SDR family oxidoreductase [Streptosporangium sp. 'caverna']|uniref:SDR family oxidoreductase n=1 Tax=Streptosporangium sp. 'caverna' TaxID=2202249 RepID=UPI000D7DCE38|nr:SDR family oxidoreductase [Streptosporangium sp. 'caverna']AWS44050.1 3-oxoacyl-ACP reductase [Streptosporangium sp. 'caverna']
MSADRVAVVTGAGSGLGRAISQALGGEGWSVVLAGRREEPLRRTADSLTGGATSVVVPTDVGRPESVQALFSEVGRRFERLDLLVNNAGTFGPSASPEDVSYEEWRSTVDVNLTGSFLCAQAAFRMMRDQRPQGGRIINNGSLSAHTPRPNSIAYTATKHAITGLTKSLSLDGRRYGIACGQIDIGNAATEMTAAMSAGVRQADGSIAVEPTVDADHVARAVLYMAGLPLDANVLSMTVMATAMPFVGRG